MTPNDNFKNALKTGKLADALVIALSKATELKITTSIVSANDYYGKNSQPHPEDCLETKINLLKGEINNKVGEKLLNNQAYETLQKLHLEEAIQGNQIIQNNLETLQELFEILAHLKQQKLEVSNPEILSLHLGNQLLNSSPLPPPPPPPKLSPIQKNSSEITVTENNPKTIEKTDSKKRNRQKRYDWKTLTESIKESEQHFQNEIPEITIETKELLEEDWGDLIIDEDTTSNQNIIEQLSVKSKTISKDTTLISRANTRQIATEKNAASSRRITSEDDMIEPISIEDSIEEDKIDLNTQAISESEVKALRAQENEHNLSLNPKKTSTSSKNKIFEVNIGNYNLPSSHREIAENEINVMLPEENWEDLLADSEQLEIEESELLDMPEVVSLNEGEDDWDEVIEELYEPKIWHKDKQSGVKNQE